MKKKLTLGVQLINEPEWIGGTLYLHNLVICLARLPESERPHVRLLGSPEVISHFYNEWGHLPIFPSHSVKSPWGRFTRFLGADLKESEIDVVYPGFGTAVPSAVTIRWIPDFQHRYLPELFSASELAARDHAIGEIAACSGVVVFSSAVALADFCRFYPDHSAVPFVWHFCSIVNTMSAPLKEVVKKYDLPEKYLYLPNQFWAHKNHITVLKALALLREKYDIIIPLVCTGLMNDRRNDKHISGLFHFIDTHGMSNQVHMLGLIDRKEQIEVLRHAAAIVQPSLFEGWSTVVEDTRSIGRPIFLSDIPVHREQNPQTGYFFSPESDHELAELLVRYWAKLPAGPDIAAEQQARMMLDENAIKSARNFCDMVEKAVMLSNKSA
jgi:glycosyltransferase involved in cell wall biosynthesis